MIGTILITVIIIMFITAVVLMRFKVEHPMIKALRTSGKLISQRWHAFFNSAMGEKYKESVLEHKKDLFTTMAHKMNHNDTTLLEIGTGHGANLQFLPSDMKIQLVALDPNRFCKPYLEKTLDDHPNVTLKQYVEGGAEDMAMVTSESIDCVLSTIVLCSVQDQTKVLAEVRRVLKPGGYFFFMEHVHAKERSIMALFQMLLNPLNSFLLDGCNVNRKTWETIHKAGFSEVQCQKFDAGLYYQFAMLRPHISGYALK